MMKKSLKSVAITAFVVCVSIQSASAGECAAGVSSALDQQRERYIAAQSDMAAQNYSKRPGSFASTTCLDSLMTQGGLDIFFKPPSLDNIIEMVKNLACDQASQIFESLVGGSGLNASSLQPGEIIQGINLGGNLLNSISSAGSSGGVSSLVQSLIGSGTSSSDNQIPVSDISTALSSVFK